MLCYASLAYKMTWRPSHRYCKEAKIRMVSLNMLFNCHTLTSLSLHIPVLSSGLNWSPPIVNQLVAIEYQNLRTLLFWGVGDRTAGERKRGEATTTACMFGRGSALRITFESFFSISRKISQIPSWLDWTTSTSRRFLLLQELALILHIL